MFYDKSEFTVEPEGVMFPSPREVNWVSYKTEILIAKIKELLFPSPLEVDRFLYFMQKQFTNTKSYGFRPLSRQIGSYTQTF